MIVIEVRLPCLRPRLKNTSRGFPNSLFGNLLLGEDQIVTNLPYMVKSNHNLLSGEDFIIFLWVKIKPFTIFLRVKIKPFTNLPYGEE
jgi:hypothetical protein